jgi:hypothetical protein
MNNKIKAVVIALIITISIIGLTLTNFDRSSTVELEAIPQADKTIVILGETISFSAENCKGEIVAYYWNFGDDQNSVEKNPSHVYNTLGWHNVTLTVIDKESNQKNSTIVIGIQHTDEYDSGEHGAQSHFDPRGHSGRGLRIDIAPNIGNPTISFKFKLGEPYGALHTRSYFYWEIDGHVAGTHEFFEENFLATGSDIVREYLVEPDQFPGEYNKYYAELQFEVSADTGGWRSLEFMVESTYVNEDIQMQ